jgi:predicted nucleic acid-binding protein
VNIYAESSAVLAWLLGEETGHSVREALQHAELVMASDLTLVECDRVLIHAVTTREIDEATAADRRAHLNAAASHWHLWRVTPDIIERARHPFPAEPIRTLDAIHLASALAVRSAVPGLELLSLDDRIRRAAKQLGFHVHPLREATLSRSEQRSYPQ